MLTRAHYCTCCCPAADTCTVALFCTICCLREGRAGPKKVDALSCSAGHDCQNNATQQCNWRFGPAAVCTCCLWDAGCWCNLPVDGGAIPFDTCFALRVTQGLLCIPYEAMALAWVFACFKLAYTWIHCRLGTICYPVKQRHLLRWHYSYHIP